MVFKGLAINTRWLWIPVLVVFFTLPNTFTYAENQSQQSKEPLEVWQEALLYSKDHPVVSFAVYGRTKQFTSLENAEKITGFFAHQNIKSKYFLAMEDDMGSAVEFFIQGVPYGPVGLTKALPLIQQVANHYKEEYLNAH